MNAITQPPAPDHTATIRQSLARAWRHRRRTDIADLVSNNYRLSEIVEAQPGRYDIDDIPWYRQILDCMGDPELRELAILKSTQVVGTVSTQGGMIALAVADPSTAMIVAPTQDEARRTRDRIYHNALKSKRIFADMVPPESQWNMQAIELGSAVYNLAWAGSAQRLRGKPCKRVLYTECDVYEILPEVGDPVQAGEERTKQYYDSLLIYESTPVGDDSRIFKKFEATRKHFWWVDCPHCGKPQPLRFFTYTKGQLANRGGLVGYRDASGTLKTPEDARRDARYICINGCEIDQSWKTTMTRGGRWVAEGQQVDADTKQLTGKPIVESRERMGFHVWSMMSSKITFGDIASKYVRLVADGLLRDFFQNDLGLRFRQHKPVPKWETIASTFATPYMSRSVPDSCLFLTAGIDVQETHLLWTVVGWSHTRTPWVIDWGEIERSAAVESNIEDLDEEEIEAGVILDSDLRQIPGVLLERGYHVNGSNPIGRTALPVRLTGIDSRYRRAQVVDFVRTVMRSGTDRLRAVQGVDRMTSGKNWDDSKIDKDPRTGKSLADSMPVWNIYKVFYQEQIEERLVAAPDQPKAFRFPDDILPRGKKFLRQLTNVRRNQKGIFEKVNGQLGEDFRDCLAIAEACADMVLGEIGWHPSDWKTYIDKINAAQAKAKTKTKTDQTIVDR